MSLLDRARSARPGATPGAAQDDRSSHGSRALLAWELVAPGIRTALATWLVLALPSLLAWVVAPLSSVSWLQAAGIAGAGWYLAHGLSVSVGATSVGLAPLGLTALMLLMTTRSVRRLLDNSEAAARGTTWPHRLVSRLLPGYALGYLTVALMVWLTTLAGAARPSALAVPATLGVPFVATLICLLRRHGRGEPAPLVGALLDRAPRWVTRAIGPGVWGGAALGACGLVVVVVALVVRMGTVTALHTSLDAGFVGGAVLVVGQLLVVPDLAVWATAWLAGPGFSLGQGTSVTLSGAHPGLLPLVPVLGVLPTGGEFPGWVLALLATPVLVGAVVSWLACRSLARLSSWRTKLETAGAACLVSAVLVLAAMLLASGSLGVQRLQHVGPDPWLVTGAVLGELVVGALAHLGVDRLLQRR
ncbi:MAG: DUF6350 family protein [Actinomycetota bacterium]|nr:DUF6350 family protein [Actinomycetota bacterium]